MHSEQVRDVRAIPDCGMWPGQGALQPPARLRPGPRVYPGAPARRRIWAAQRTSQGSRSGVTSAYRVVKGNTVHSASEAWAWFLTRLCRILAEFESTCATV